MTITLSVLDGPRSEVRPPSFRSQPKPSYGAMVVVDDHAAVGRDLLAPLGRILVHAARIQAGQRVLDAAGGTGIAAIPAALRGAEVVASDITREHLEVGRNAAARRGAVIDWRSATPRPSGMRRSRSTPSCRVSV